ncbi:MAG TPA: FMN-binding glutamate synthase family protein [Desulfosporosinus sp.]
MQITLNIPEWLMILILSFALLLVIFLVSILFAKPIIRIVIGKIIGKAVKRLFTDKYTQNIAELWSSLNRFSVLNLIETSLRAENGKIIARPLGSPKHFLGFENLMFSPQIMTRFSLQESTTVDMQVTIGPNAAKPLTIGIPLMISAMAYGLALSEESKRALARAAKALQTVTCSGEGPFLPEERADAGKYVLQICRWQWGGRTDEQISSADMLEVQMGQGADIGTALVEAVELQGRAQVLAGLAPGQSAISFPAPPGVQTPEDWPGFMATLRQRANGIPIALKLMATGHLEDDLAVAVDLGFDAVILDGAQGGSHAVPPIKEDDFGIPSLNALVRAERYLKNSQISLIVAGGYFTPGQCLKALALGADAVYLATVPLFALGHGQLDKVIPWEPPTTLLYYDSPTKTQLNIDQAATNVINALQSMVLEMEEGIRALGKASLKELNSDDLVALDALTAEITGVTRVY